MWPHSSSPEDARSHRPTHSHGSTDSTTVSPASEDSVVLQAVRLRKASTHSEIMGRRRRARLVVLAGDVGGRWSEETQRFLSLQAKAKARSEPPILRQAWTMRWGSILSRAAARAFAGSQLKVKHGGGGADGDVSLAHDVVNESRHAVVVMGFGAQFGLPVSSSHLNQEKKKKERERVEQRGGVQPKPSPPVAKTSGTRPLGNPQSRVTAAQERVVKLEAAVASARCGGCRSRQFASCRSVPKTYDNSRWACRSKSARVSCREPGHIWLAELDTMRTAVCANIQDAEKRLDALKIQLQFTPAPQPMDADAEHWGNCEKRLPR